MGKTIIINEGMLDELKDYLNMTQFKFRSNIRKFLAALLEDPVGAEPDIIFKHHGIDKNKLIKSLVDNKVIKKKMNIDDHDADGTPHTAKMIVTYSVPKEHFNEKLDSLFSILFPDVDGVIPEFGKTDVVNEAVTGDDSNKSAALYVYNKDKDDNWYILCAKRSNRKGDEEGGKWNPPMGHLHKGEAMKDGALRECLEESGIDFSRYKSELKQKDKQTWGCNFVLTLGDYVTPEVTIDDFEPKKGDEENSKFIWLLLSKIEDRAWAWTCGDNAIKFIPEEIDLLESKQHIDEKKTRKNEDGEIVPENCTCGAKIGLFIKGEPVYLCTKCGKYYGVKPFSTEIQENCDCSSVDGGGSGSGAYVAPFGSKGGNTKNRHMQEPFFNLVKECDCGGCMGGAIGSGVKSNDGGATNAQSSGQHIKSFMGPIRRKKKNVDEETEYIIEFDGGANHAAGDYGLAGACAFGGDDETLDRTPGNTMGMHTRVGKSNLKNKK